MWHSLRVGELAREFGLGGRRGACVAGKFRVVARHVQATGRRYETRPSDSHA